MVNSRKPSRKIYKNIATLQTFLCDFVFLCINVKSKACIPSCGTCIFMSHTYASYSCLTSSALLIIKVCSSFSDACQQGETGHIFYPSFLYIVSHTCRNFVPIHSLNHPSPLQAKFRSFVSSVAWLLTSLANSTYANLNI